ncbi:hypothetical protein [Streptomyces sp. NPDC086838]|uniref:hypothetical protein n=1 Tax=Streptomyces sp. NPDC086838 TaxID=3365762 RepID=UPI0037F63D3E
MSAFVGKFLVLTVAVLGISIPVSSSFSQTGQTERTAVVADSGWGPIGPETAPVSEAR